MLNPPQQELVESGLLDTGFSWVLQLPTGSGKTYLAEQAIERAVRQGQRAVYLTPLRALANELGARWAERFPHYRVGVYTGETLAAGQPPVRPMAETDILILTPERLDACTRFWRTHWDWLPDVALLVVDEVHLLGDPNRGPRLEGTLLRVRRLNPLLRVLALSATLGNREELADWLDGIEYVSDWRAVPLTWRTRTFRKAEQKPDILAEEVHECIERGGQSLVFVQSRRRAEALAQELTGQGLPAAHHHGGLSSVERNRAEANFRAGECRVLVSTGTLEMGLNLPVRQVILYDLQFFNGEDFSPLPVNTVWQRAGRAGRRGLDAVGEVVLVVPSWDRNRVAYDRGRFEPIVSRLTDSRFLAEQILIEVGSGLSRTRAQVARSLSGSLAVRQGRTLPVESSLNAMLTSGMLTETADEKHPERLHLRATRLGRIAVRQLLSPETMLHLARLVNPEAPTPLTLFDLLLIAATAPDCEPVLRADFEELESLSERLEREVSFLLQAPAPQVAQHLGVSPKRLLAAIKMALAAHNWTRIGEPDDPSGETDLYPFEVRRLTESLERILTALTALLAPEINEHDVVEALLNGTAPRAAGDVRYRKARALRDMIAYGVNEYAVGLTVIDGIGGILARRLWEAGFHDLEDLAQADAKTVAQVRGVGIERARDWIEAAGLRLEPDTTGFDDEGPRVRPAPADWPEGIDPYRLGRARDLSVESLGGVSYRVTGGLEPHTVEWLQRAPLCDCHDHQKGNTCKHLLAVRLFRGDGPLMQAAARLSTQTASTFDLHNLWTGGSK